MFLYNMILEKSIPHDLVEIPTARVAEFIKIVKTLDGDVHEKIYALIKYHHIVSTATASATAVDYTYPYTLKKTPTAGLRVDFAALPLKLQYILIQFVKLHQDVISNKCS